MISRRILIASAACALLPRHGVAGQGPVTLAELKAAFDSRDRGARQMVQTSLKGAGYYTSGIDGAWGPGMEKAFDRLMASKRYRRAASQWTWARDVQVIETLFFLTSDAYMD